MTKSTSRILEGLNLLRGLVGPPGAIMRYLTLALCVCITFSRQGNASLFEISSAEGVVLKQHFIEPNNAGNGSEKVWNAIHVFCESVYESSLTMLTGGEGIVKTANDLQRESSRCRAASRVGIMHNNDAPVACKVQCAGNIGRVLASKQDCSWEIDLNCVSFSQLTLSFLIGDRIDSIVRAGNAATETPSNVSSWRPTHIFAVEFERDFGVGILQKTQSSKSQTDPQPWPLVAESGVGLPLSFMHRFCEFGELNAISLSGIEKKTEGDNRIRANEQQRQSLDYVIYAFWLLPPFIFWVIDFWFGIYGLSHATNGGAVCLIACPLFGAAGMLWWILVGDHFALTTENAAVSSKIGASATPYRGSKYVRVVPVVVPEFEFCDVQRQVFSADVVELAHDAALQQRPEAVDCLSVDNAINQ